MSVVKPYRKGKVYRSRAEREALRREPRYTVREIRFGDITLTFVTRYRENYGLDDAQARTRMKQRLARAAKRIRREIESGFGEGTHVVEERGLTLTTPEEREYYKAINAHPVFERMKRKWEYQRLPKAWKQAIEEPE